jgi:hypothetical protein
MMAIPQELTVAHQVALLRMDGTAMAETTSLLMPASKFVVTLTTTTMTLPLTNAMITTQLMVTVAQLGAWLKLVGIAPPAGS